MVTTGEFFTFVIQVVGLGVVLGLGGIFLSALHEASEQRDKVKQRKR